MYRVDAVVRLLDPYLVLVSLWDVRFVARAPVFPDPSEPFLAVENLLARVVDAANLDQQLAHELAHGRVLIGVAQHRLEDGGKCLLIAARVARREPLLRSNILVSSWN